MSSPERNCFLAAARTASFIASITRSRSMPCSWQSASIFCAIDELMKVSLSQWTARSVQYFIYVHFQVRFSNHIQRNTYLPTGSIFKKDVIAVHSQQPASEVALPANGLARFHLRLAACESFEIGRLIQAS